MPSTFLCQFEILGLLALAGLLYLDFPRDSKFQHDHLKLNVLSVILAMFSG